jgi:hypothetical protein
VLQIGLIFSAVFWIHVAVFFRLGHCCDYLVFNLFADIFRVCWKLIKGGQFLAKLVFLEEYRDVSAFGESLDPVAFGILDSLLRLGKVAATVRQLCDLLVVGLRGIAMNYRDARYCYELRACLDSIFCRFLVEKREDRRESHQTVCVFVDSARRRFSTQPAIELKRSYS